VAEPSDHDGATSGDDEPARDDGPPNFVRDIVAADVAAGREGGRVVTRFPPEPNGYLHLGHAKAICLDFGMAADFGGHCNLRFDDTNPEAEDVEYVDSIQEDVRWLGFSWGERALFASDYYPQLHAWAVELIRRGKAYVDSQSPEQIRALRGDFHHKGRNSPFRERSVEENLGLFERMRRGELAEGEAVLRAKIDMESPNINLRDPPIYRIKKVPHHRTGDAWCIYPMYDYAHGLCDAIEGVTHSLCTLEFEDHRPLYDWFLEQLPVPSHPRQIEFARLNVDYMIMSKRKLLRLVADGHVSGWDDPRMPTLSGLRRRGVTPEAIRAFCERVGVAKRDGSVDITLFEHEIREHLNATSPRLMGVLDPLRLVITNYPEGETERFQAPLHPEDPSMGARELPFSRELWIERDDFREIAPRKWHRLAPGQEVRLRWAGLVTCREVIKDAAGRVVELRCTWDPQSRGGNAPDGRRVKGTIHWVSAAHAVEGQARLYGRLFSVPDPGAHGDRPLAELLAPDSLELRDGCRFEPAVAGLASGARIQLERLGYFCVDPDRTPARPVLNRTIALRDSWAKIEGKAAGG
jgi:glutaminyl-tRNA synthetase